MSLGELEKIHEPLWATPLRGCVKHDRHLVKIRNGKMRYYLPEEQAIDEIKRTHIEKGLVYSYKFKMQAIHFSSMRIEIEKSVSSQPASQCFTFLCYCGYCGWMDKQNKKKAFYAATIHRGFYQLNNRMHYLMIHFLFFRLF